MGPQPLMTTLERLLKGWKANRGFTATIKWGKVSPSRYEDYKSVIDNYLGILRKSPASFRCALFNTSEFDHEKYSDGDKELTFHRMYRTQLIQMARNTCRDDPDAQIYVRAHRRRWRHFEGIEDEINSRLRKFGINSNPVRKVSLIPIEQSAILQATDICLGAVGYHKHGLYMLDGANLSKGKLCMRMAYNLEVSVLGNSFMRHGFSVWNVELGFDQN